MCALEHARSYRDLIVYQGARLVAKKVFVLTKAFPRDEAYSLVSQVRRSSRSIGAQIAEAWAKRRYEKHFVSKLTDADGERQETLHWLDTARDCGYVDGKTVTDLEQQLSEIGRMLNGMIEKAALFCGSAGERTAECMATYLADDVSDVRPDN